MDDVIKTVDLFCGAGGASWGARKAGANVVCGVDAWGLAVDTFRDNFEGAQAIQAKLTPRSDGRLLAGVGRVDLLLASPECTNHTCARGSRPPDERSRGTANYVLRFARDLDPRWIVVENVVHMKRWLGYEQLLRRLRERYHVRIEVLDAQDFGVPQSRRRLFILCDRHREPRAIVRPRRVRTRSAESVIDWDGPWAFSPLDNGRRSPATIERARRAIATLGRGVPFLLVYYGSDAAGGWQTIDRPLRTLTTLDRFGLVRWEGRSPVMRMLQVPEIQRAMGFDTGFKLERGSRRERIRLLGNAVCPPVMKAIIVTLTAD
jgi:DNA (cytosine-5)-methyltransferase 1